MNKNIVRIVGIAVFAILGFGTFTKYLQANDPNSVNYALIGLALLGLAFWFARPFLKVLDLKTTQNNVPGVVS